MYEETEICRTGRLANICWQDTSPRLVVVSVQEAAVWAFPGPARWEREEGCGRRVGRCAGSRPEAAVAVACVQDRRYTDAKNGLLPVLAKDLGRITCACRSAAGHGKRATTMQQRTAGRQARGVSEWCVCVWSACERERERE